MPGCVNLRGWICPGKLAGHFEIDRHRDLIFLTLRGFLSAKNCEFSLVDNAVAVLRFQIAVIAALLSKRDKSGLIFVVKILIKLDRGLGTLVDSRAVFLRDIRYYSVIILGG